MRGDDKAAFSNPESLKVGVQDIHPHTWILLCSRRLALIIILSVIPAVTCHSCHQPGWTVHNTCPTYSLLFWHTNPLFNFWNFAVLPSQYLDIIWAQKSPLTTLCELVHLFALYSRRERSEPDDRNPNDPNDNVEFVFTHTCTRGSKQCTC